MRIVRIIATAGAALLASTALAHADPVSIAILGFLGIKATAGTLLVSAVTYGLTTLASIGLSLARAALNKPKAPGVSFELEIGDDSPIGFVTGKYATPGTRKYINTYKGPGDAPNNYLVEVIQYGDLPCPGIPGIWANSETATLLLDEEHPEMGYPIEQFRKNGRDHGWVKVKDGTDTVADPYLLAKFDDPDKMPWLADMIGRGCPHLIFTARYAPKVHKRQPQWLIEPPPQPWYDPRKDSTNGGSGAHRWGQWETYEPTTNPVVMIYNIIRGVYYGTEWVYGGQNLSAYRLPASNWMAAANECDVEIEIDEETTEPQFRAGFEVRGDMEPLAVISELRKACSGRIAEVGGRFKILVGAPGAAVYSFDDGDIVVTREQGFRPYPRLDETINAIEATYPEPGEMWAQKDAPAIYSDEFQEADAGFSLPDSVEFSAVPFSAQVQRQMATMLADDRCFRTHPFYLPPDAYPVEGLDTVSWSSERNGYTNKKFLVVRKAGEPGMNQFVFLKEIDLSGGGGNYQPVAPVPPGLPPPEVQANPTFDAEGHVVRDETGAPRRSSIKVSYASDLDDVRAVWVKVYLAGDDELIYSYEIPYGDPEPDGSPDREVVLNGTFLPVTAYDVTGELVPISRRDTVPTARITVTTPDVRLDMEELGDDVRNFQKWIGGSLRDLQDEYQQLHIRVSDQELANFNDKQTLRQEIVVKTGEITTAYSDAITLAAGPNSALAIRTTVLEALMPDKADAIVLSAQIARIDDHDGEIIALGEMVQGVETTVGQVSASGKFRVTTEATMDGATATIGFGVATSGGGSPSSSAVLMSATSGGDSLFAVIADRWLVVDPDDLDTMESPMYFDDGTLYLRNINIENAVIGNLQVGTSNIVAGAVSVIESSAQSSTPITLSGGNNWTDILSVSVSGLANAKRLFKAYVDISSLSPNSNVGGISYTVDFRIVRGATVVCSKTIARYSTAAGEDPITNGSAYIWDWEVVLFGIDSTGAASETYTFQIRRQALTAALYATNAYVEAVELKR